MTVGVLLALKELVMCSKSANEKVMKRKAEGLAKLAHALNSAQSAGTVHTVVSLPKKTLA